MSGNSIYQPVQSLAQDCKCSILCSFLEQLLLQIVQIIYHVAGITKSL